MTSITEAARRQSLTLIANIDPPYPVEIQTGNGSSRMLVDQFAVTYHSSEYAAQELTLWGHVYRKSGEPSPARIMRHYPSNQSKPALIADFIQVSRPRWLKGSHD